MACNESTCIWTCIANAWVKTQSCPSPCQCPPPPGALGEGDFCISLEPEVMTCVGQDEDIDIPNLADCCHCRTGFDDHNPYGGYSDCFCCSESSKLVPRRWRLTLEGITNNGCTHCEDLNDEHILDFLSCSNPVCPPSGIGHPGCTNILNPTAVLCPTCTWCKKVAAIIPAPCLPLPPCQGLYAPFDPVFLSIRFEMGVSPERDGNGALTGNYLYFANLWMLHHNNFGAPGTGLCGLNPGGINVEAAYRFVTNYLPYRPCFGPLTLEKSTSCGDSECKFCDNYPDSVTLEAA